MNLFSKWFFIFLVQSIIECWAIADINDRTNSIDYAVRVTSQTGDQAVIEGASIVLYCDVRTMNGGMPVNLGNKIQYRWLFNGLNLNSEPRKYTNNNQLIIAMTDYPLDSGEYKCQCFLPQTNHPFESAPYTLNIHWISKKAEIVYFKYPEQDDVDLPIQLLPIESINQFKLPFKIGLKCKASGYPELQFDWYLNDEVIVAPNARLSGSKYSLEDSSEGSNLYIIGQDLTVNGAYTCSVRNSVGSLKSENNFIIKVRNKRPSLELKSITNDLIVTEGQKIVLNCEFNNYDNILWYSPAGSRLANSSRIKISANSSVLIVDQADKSIDEGAFKCIGVRVDKRQSYSIRVRIAFIDEFASQYILALYNQNYRKSDDLMQVIVIPERSKFEIVRLPPKSVPEAKIYWIDSQNKSISNQGKIRMLDNHRLLLQSAQLEHTGIYRCIAENIAGKREKSIMIKVQRLPILANRESQHELTVKELTNLTLDCLEPEMKNFTNNNQTYFTIQWYHNGSLINSIDKRKLVNNLGQLTIISVHSLDHGLYFCELNHTGYPVTYSEAINLKVIELLKFISLPVDRRLELNRSAKIHCKAELQSIQKI